MKCKAGLKGRPTKNDKRSMRYQCDKVYLDASAPEDTYILAAIYRAIFVEDNSLTRSIVRAAKKLAREEGEVSDE